MSTDWRDQALCREVDPELFFPEDGVNATDAKWICSLCDVAAECRAEALAGDIRYGVWGGLTERDRRKLKRAQRSVVEAA